MKYLLYCEICNKYFSGGFISIDLETGDEYLFHKIHLGPGAGTGIHQLVIATAEMCPHIWAPIWGGVEECELCDKRRKRVESWVEVDDEGNELAAE